MLRRAASGRVQSASTDMKRKSRGEFEINEIPQVEGFGIGQPKADKELIALRIPYLLIDVHKRRSARVFADHIGQIRNLLVPEFLICSL